ncbi:MFS transporter [Halobellus rufus]|uniref:MFS transporter n=1 Tax=Halobellus rufus TaxID=1448860 RepID=UPI0006793472|nr:MFS transporter [Halobellus rufus]
MTTSHDTALDSLTSWLVALLGMVLLVLIWGMIFTFTVYSQPIEAAFGLSSLRVSSVFSITTATFYIAGGAIGVVISRAPLRPVVAVSGLVFAIAAGLLEVVSSYPGVLLAFALLGTAGGTIFVVVVSLVPQWFDEYQGRAMGVTMIGNGLGVFVLPPVWVFLLERMSITEAFVVVGWGTAAVILLSSLLYRRPPGVRAAASTPVDTAWLRARLTDRAFLAAIAGFALLWSWYFVLSADFVGILTENGIGRTVAATAFGIVGGISVVTRVAGGAVADRLGLRVTMTAGVVFAAIGMGGLPLATTTLAMYVLLAFFGVGLGVAASLFSPIILERFGATNATAIIGVFTIAEATTAISIPLLLNVLRDLSGGYTVPLVVVTALTLLGAALFYRGTASQSA